MALCSGSMTERPTQRLFFALWPAGAQREQLLRYFPLLRGCGGRRVRPENLHITLAFLGSVDAATRTCLEQAANNIDIQPFTLYLQQLGFWRRPRVVWLGANEEPPELLTLVGELKKAMLKCGLEPDTRPFRAHLTLLRKAYRTPRVEQIPLLEWPVSHFVLVASQTRPEGAVYEIVRSWELDSGFKV
jgi:2'-5' RNA ligase